MIEPLDPEDARFRAHLDAVCAERGIEAPEEWSGFLRYDGTEEQWIVMDGHYLGAQVEAVAEALKRIREAGAP
jgi:hypothetical protein